LNTNPRSASFNVAFERRLRELGYVEGKNLIIDDVYAEGKVERLAPLARELVARKPDVLFISGPEAPLKALSEATRTIPIVVCAVDFDPVATGYLKRLARPGGNITGVHVQQIEATAKRLELLHHLVPRRGALWYCRRLHRGPADCAQDGEVLKLNRAANANYPYDYAPASTGRGSKRSDAGSDVCEVRRSKARGRGPASKRCLRCMD
jgi:hypothetical protein